MLVKFNKATINQSLIKATIFNTQLLKLCINNEIGKIG